MRRVYPFFGLAFLALAACSGGNNNEPPQLTTEERLALPADAANGERLFRACAVCHNKIDGVAHRMGPNMPGIVGAPSARFPDFAYSRALERAEIIWTEENLDAYIEDPQGLVPRTRMGWVGEPDPANRRDMIAFLKTLEPTTEE